MTASSASGIIESGVKKWQGKKDDSLSSVSAVTLALYLSC